MLGGEGGGEGGFVAAARIHNLTLLTKGQKILGYPYVNSVWKIIIGGIYAVSKYANMIIGVIIKEGKPNY